MPLIQWMADEVLATSTIPHVLNVFNNILAQGK